MASNHLAEAAPFRYTAADALEFEENWTMFWDKEALPNPQTPVDWELILLKPFEMFKHQRLLFKECRTGKGFLIDMFVDVDKQSVQPRVKKYNPRYQGKAKELGKITKSAIEIFHTALSCLKKFGQYNEYTNNCQHYCQMVSEALGCKSYWTDTGKVAAGVGLGAVLLGGLGLLAYSMSSNEDTDPKDKK